MKNVTWQLTKLVLCLSASSGIVTLAILLASMGTYSPLVPAVNITHGQSIFRNRCASCHSVEPDSPTGRGPNLGTLADRKPYPAGGITDYLLESIVQPQASRSTKQFGYMPNAARGLSRKEIVSLVGYLLDEMGKKHSLRDLSYKYSSFPIDEMNTNRDLHPTFEEISSGREIFFGKGKCASCHDWIAWENYTWEKVTSMGPNLMNVGTKPRSYLQDSILEPSTVILSGYESTSILLEDGRTVSGRIITQDDTVCTLIGNDSNNNPKLFDVEKSSIEAMKTQTVSSMPSYKGFLTEEEVEALVAFISYL